MRSGRYILACWLWLACGLGCNLLPKPAANSVPSTAATGGQPPAAVPAAGNSSGGGVANPNANSLAAQKSAAAALAADMHVAPTPSAAVSASPPPSESATSGTTVPATPAAASARPSASANAQALLQTLSELQAIGAIDPETQQRVIGDLKQIDPALWPQLLQYYRASLALRKKTEPATASDDGSAAAAAPGPSADSRPPLAGPAAASSPPVVATAPAADSALICATEPAEPAPRARELTASKSAATAIEKTATTDPGPAAAKPSSPAVQVAASPAVADNSAPAEPKKPAVDEDPNSWEEHLRAAVASLENATGEPAQSASEASRHAALRMLYLISGRRDDALKPIRGIPPGQQDFWSQELYGLANYLDTDRNPDGSRRAAEAVDRLREAAIKLGEQATLSVKNLTFCTEVTSFGVYKAFGKDEFKAGQEVLLYAEVENFKSRQTDKGYQTALRSSYQILDPHGARVEAQDFEITEEHCHNLRRDFFMRYHIWMPKRIYGGRYTLQLTIEDTLSQKLGQSSVEFTIKE